MGISEWQEQKQSNHKDEDCKSTHQYVRRTEMLGRNSWGNRGDMQRPDRFLAGMPYYSIARPGTPRLSQIPTSCLLNLGKMNTPEPLKHMNS